MITTSIYKKIKMLQGIFAVIILATLLSSCHTTKDLGYFEDIKDSMSGTIEVADYQIKIKPEDELLITVSSEVPEATKQFNQNIFNPISRNDLQQMAGTVQSLSNTANTSGTSRLSTYLVDKKGDISIPTLGQIHVAGMTTSELSEYLTDKISATVKNPTVKVTLINFKINVLGEVNLPQTITVTSEKFSVLDAIAASGDLTEYGKRENVIIIRETEDGNRTYQRINLHDSNIFSSPYYYLQQNDIVYVEPNSIKQDNSKYNQNNSFKLSTISTIVSAASVIASLVIALTVK